ncbi:MAG: S8/S53 family peptidase [Cyanobacteria bacterium SZAS LIN-2]|nr:S8/S53 family peptidase [Cyanobacteria bacterium SZAS LIN-2]
MTEQFKPGDSQSNSGSRTSAEVQANMAQIANDFLEQGIQDKSKAAPSSTLGKVGMTTVVGAEKTFAGMAHAIVDDIQHPLQTAEMIGTSAAMGAVLKTVLPETGVAGKIAGAGIGLYFMAKAASPIYSAYKEGANATTMDDINKAGANLGDATGGFIVNSAIAAGGYRIGAGFTGKMLLSEKFDGFANAKEKFWNPKSTEGVPNIDVLEPTRSAGYASRVKMEGNRATLLDTERKAPANATLKGDVDPAAPMDVYLYAQTKGSALEMNRAVQRISNGMQKPMTDAEITAKFGAAPESVAAINKFASDHGLTVAEHNPASGMTRLTGSTESMMKAFDVKLQEYEHQSGVRFRGRTGTISVAGDLAPHVKGILGLDNRPQFKTNYVKGVPDAEPAAGEVSGAVGGITPKNPQAAGAKSLEVEQVMKAYNVPAGTTGEGQVTGFLSLGGRLPDQWEGYLQKKGIDPKTVEIRNAGSTEPANDPQGANGENALDLFIHKQALPKAKTVMVEAENNDTGMPTGIDRIAFPKPGEAQITHASISWGMYEDGWTNQAIALMNDAGKRAALKGITITVASGDNGAGDGSPSHKQQVDLPAGLEHFTASGGTRLVLNADGSINSEVGWDGMGASGGGRSMKTPRPDYQKGVDLPPNLNGSKFDGRGVPDIAANGDPRSGWKVWTDDGVQPIGGTSASAPADAVIAAIISKATGKTTGFWNPELYNMGAKNPGVFNDVVSGRNTDGGVKGYPAGKGWDAETGWGSVDVGRYIDVRSKMLGQSSFVRNMNLVPGYLSQNHTHVPGWALPYQPGSDGSNK